ncbi:hypothetical protein GCM10010145_65170 [Streptomyces ruber]|uniref:Uncharacterized protein n=2 Tax=Streptomyces TaxID=1883 RepID=A0A918EYI2_9ACTN|nr:hypothetical protein GCM10010145_65170 [Streptomyces ruber]
MEVAHEAGVHECDALVAGHLGEQCLGVTGVGGDPHVEAQLPQLALQGRSGDRLTGEDGGRQTNSLPGCRRGAPACAWVGRPWSSLGAGRRVGRGYRMMRSGRSPPVNGTLDRLCSASAAIIIGDSGPAPQTAVVYRPIYGGTYGTRRSATRLAEHAVAAPHTRGGGRARLAGPPPASPVTCGSTLRHFRRSEQMTTVFSAALPDTPHP